MRSYIVKFPNDWGNPKLYSRFELFDSYLPELRSEEHKYHLLIHQIDDYIVSTHKIDIDDCHECPTCRKVQPFGDGLRESCNCQLCGSFSNAGDPYEPDGFIDYSDMPDFKRFSDSFDYEYINDRVLNAFKYIGITKFGNHLFKRLL